MSSSFQTEIEKVKTALEASPLSMREIERTDDPGRAELSHGGTVGRAYWLDIDESGDSVSLSGGLADIRHSFVVNVLELLDGTKRQSVQMLEFRTFAEDVIRRVYSTDGIDVDDDATPSVGELESGSLIAQIPMTIAYEFDRNI